MPAKEMRARMVSFLLHNEQTSSMKDKGIKARLLFSFVGTDKLNDKLSKDRNFICLSLWLLLGYAGDMKEAIEELVNFIMSFQDEGF
jgi:hypothetical protein